MTSDLFNEGLPELLLLSSSHMSHFTTGSLSHKFQSHLLLSNEKKNLKIVWWVFNRFKYLIMSQDETILEVL